MEWLEDLELTCELFKITKVEQVLPPWLKSTAQETYQQLFKEQNDIEEIKHALVKAYRTFICGLQPIYHQPPSSREDCG